MLLLRDTSEAIQFEAFHVFKVFVANPKKPPEITRILLNNRSKLIAYLENFQNEKNGGIADNVGEDEGHLSSKPGLSVRAKLEKAPMESLMKNPLWRKFILHQGPRLEESISNCTVVGSCQLRDTRLVFLGLRRSWQK